ncbi:MAG: Rap1a/Tai family immunity protein [Gammaproteobacteria bacterium]|nr:Rap1a/Tai family immunity protein [Gammaproteobacteria bacterium]
MKATILGLLLLCSTSVWAVPSLEDCEQSKPTPDSSSKEIADYSVCVNYLGGMVVADQGHRFQGAKPWMGCVPNDVKDGEQLRLALVEYVREHPRQRDLIIAELAARAFSEEWPCE